MTKIDGVPKSSLGQIAVFVAVADAGTTRSWNGSFASHLGIASAPRQRC